MKYIAHRGFWDSSVKPNSYEAIYNGFKSNYFIGIECDIRETKDGYFVIYHDILYNGNLIKNIKYNNLSNICTLEDILKIDTNKIYLLEIKEIRSIKKFIKLLNKYNRCIYIMSFDKRIIDKLKSISNKYKYGILNYIVNTNVPYNLDFICLLDIISNKHIIDKYEKNNIEVFIYGVINPIYDYIYIIDYEKILKN